MSVAWSPIASHGLRREPVANGAACWIGRLAVRALYAEAVLYPKPGLVSTVDSGAHDDMTIGTFYRSLFALRTCFPAIAALGAARAPLTVLQAKGLEAEASMLRATQGVNTHRGAIFNLGLLCAAAGAVVATGRSLDASSACAWVRGAWGADLRRGLATAPAVTHGMRMARAFGVGGARAEAAGGFRSVRTWALPAFRATLAATGDPERASIQALFVLIARLSDSNLLWRGGREGLAWAQRSAAQFLAQGGATTPGWRPRAVAVHRAFVARGLSPGGSADLLAVTRFLAALDAARCRER